MDSACGVSTVALNVPETPLECPQIFPDLCVYHQCFTVKTISQGALGLRVIQNHRIHFSMISFMIEKQSLSSENQCLPALENQTPRELAEDLRALRAFGDRHAFPAARL